MADAPKTSGGDNNNYDTRKYMPGATGDDSQIDELKKKLFSNSGEELPAQRRIHLHKHGMMVNDSWQEDVADANPVVKGKTVSSAMVENMHNMRRGNKNRTSIFKTILIVSIILLVGALAFAWYAFSSGINDISSNNIDINLLGPVSSPSGEILSLDVNITNNNNADLELADLVMTYPQGTRSADDSVTSMLTDRVPIGTIPAHKTVTETVKSVLFGQENDQKTIQVGLEYRLQGSDSVFVKNKQYPIYIGTAPVTVNVQSVKQVIPEQDNEFDVTIQSNSTSIIKDVLLKADFPFGFDFESAAPAPSSGNNVWDLGDIQPGETRQIAIKGKLLGGDNDQRVFNFSTGTADPNDSSSIGTVFATNAVPITLEKPFLGLDLALNGQDSATFVAEAGQPIKGEITFQNNLNVPLQDVVISAQLSGAMIDKTSVLGDSSYYDSSSNTITWDNTTLSDLTQVVPNGGGALQFSFATLPPTNLNNSIYTSQTVQLDLTIQAKRLDENNVPEQIVSTISRPIKVSSDLNLDTELMRTIGPFQNTGPFPPQPEVASTYTVLVNVGNSYNEVNGAVFTATLPSYVTWLGVTYPDSNGVTYNPDTRQISWNLGNIQPGTGYASSPKEFAFQISFLPSISQLNSSPILVGQQQISGTDEYTGQVIQALHDALDTKTETDPAYVFGDEKVGGEAGPN